MYLGGRVANPLKYSLPDAILTGEIRTGYLFGDGELLRLSHGQWLCGMNNAKDVMNEQTQQRQGFVVGKLPDYSTMIENPLVEALNENVRSPMPDQVIFRQDFPAWRRTRCQRDRRLINEMARGESNLDLSKQFGISPARISQLRSEFRKDWDRFCSDAGEVDRE